MVEAIVSMRRLAPKIPFIPKPDDLESDRRSVVAVAFDWDLQVDQNSPQKLLTADELAEAIVLLRIIIQDIENKSPEELRSFVLRNIAWGLRDHAVSAGGKWIAKVLGGILDDLVFLSRG